ncbi:hypothetical protein FQR65_LT14992 [Abscondita terminalis]|nr:hypothetical protein FQR65_LT14992 [Abscondita terminalis]
MKPLQKRNHLYQNSLSENEMHKLYKNNNRTLNEVQVAIYNSDYDLIYHDDAKVDYVKENKEMLSAFQEKENQLFYRQSAGIFFASKALEPVSEMVDQVKNITAGKLQLRLKTTKEKDDSNELAHSFNGMLERLENSFDAQKYFVSNISHELRTPLAAVIAELELASEKDLDKEEYRQIMKMVLEECTQYDSSFG